MGDPICFLPTFENNTWTVPKPQQSTSYDKVQSVGNTQFGPGFSNAQFQRRHTVGIPALPDEKELQLTQHEYPLWDLRPVLTFIRPGLQCGPGPVHHVPTDEVLWDCLLLPPSECVLYKASSRTLREIEKFQFCEHRLPCNAHAFFKSWQNCSVLERVYYLRVIEQTGKVLDIWAFQFVIETLIRSNVPQELQFASRWWEFQKAHQHEWRPHMFVGGLVRRAMAETQKEWPPCVWDILNFVHQQNAWSNFYEVSAEMKRFALDLNAANHSALLQKYPKCLQVQFLPNDDRKGVFRKFGIRTAAETVEMYFYNRDQPILIQVANIRDAHMLSQLPDVVLNV